MAAPSPIKQLKILLVGDTATGKHSYIRRLTPNLPPNGTRTHKECDIISTKIKLDQDTEVPLQIFNISGSQRGKTKLQEYFKKIDGYIIMFDVTRGETFDNVLGWKNDIHNVNKSENIPSLLLASKSDLERDQLLNRVMDVMDGYRQATGFSCYFEISNKDNINIDLSMETFVRQIIEEQKSLPTTPSSISNRLAPLADRKREYKLKVLVIGEPGTGKTAVIERYVKNTFSTLYQNTIGSDLAVKVIQYSADITVKLYIWDIAGDERFGTMTKLFYKNAAGCLIVFDKSRPSTLINGAVKWKEDFDNKVNFDPDHQVPCLLIGNKSDLMDDGIVISQEYLTKFCETNKFVCWYETSARTNTNIEQSFSFLVREMMKNVDIDRDVRSRSSTRTIEIEEEIPPRKNFTACCSL